MAAIDFPNNPTLNQQFTAMGATWIWDGAKWTVATSGAVFLPLAGGAMTGPLTLASDPTVPLGAATKQYADSKMGMAGGTLTGPLILAADPTVPLGAATKQYADASASTRVLKAGDTMTGVLTAPGYVINGAVSTLRQIIGQASGAPRWSLQLGDGTAESGSNAGSNFALISYTDAGIANATPALGMDRSGNATFSGNLGAQVIYANQGNVTIAQGGATNPGLYLSIAGPSTRACFYYAAASGATSMLDFYSGVEWHIDYNGNATLTSAGAYKPGGGAWLATSDARIKTVLGDYASGLDAILALNPVRYCYKGNDTPSKELAQYDPSGEVKPHALKAPYSASPHYREATSKREFVGLIAQEVEKVLPDMVTKHEGFIDGKQVNDVRDLDTNELIYALINAVKTLTARVEVLEAR